MNSRDRRKRRLVSALLTLNELGKLRWSRRPSSPEFIECTAGNDVLCFELGQGDQPFDPSQPAEAARLIVRNCYILWLEGSAGWEDLRTLLEAVPMKFHSFARRYDVVEESALDELEALADEAT